MELRGPKAAMLSPIPVEPMHSFSHGHHHQWHMAHGHVCTTTSHNMAPILVNLCNAANYLQLRIRMQFDIGDPFQSQMTAVKTSHLLTCIT